MQPDPDDSDDFYADDRPPKPTIWWRVIALFEITISVIGNAMTLALELVEPTFYFVLDLIGFLFMPWRWIRRKQTEYNPSDENPASDSDDHFAVGEASQDLVELAEPTFYLVVDRVLFLLMPWRWFRANPTIYNPSDENPEVDSDDSIAVGEASQEIAELAESTFYVVLDRASYVIMPWRWFRGEPEADLLADMDATAPPQELEDQKLGPVAEAFFSVLGLAGAGLEIVWETFTELAERYMPRRIFWPVYLVVDVLVETFLTAYEFSMEWWFSRNFPQLLLALPALVFGMTLGTSSLLGYLQPNSKKIRHYQEQLADAVESADDLTVSFTREKLSQLGHEDMERLRFGEAIEAARRGEMAVAHELMNELAPLDEPGYLPAHLWICGGILDGVILSEDPDAMQVMHKHADHAFQLDPDNPLSRRFRLESLLQRGIIDDTVLAEMEDLAEHQRELYVTLAHHRQLRGQTVDARRAAHAAIREMEKQLRSASRQGDLFDEIKSLDLTPLGFLRIAECYALVDNRDRERAVLDEAVRLYPEDEGLREVWHGRNLIEFRNLDLKNDRIPELVASILQVESDHRDVIIRIVRGLVDGDSTSSRDTQDAAWRIVNHLLEHQLLPKQVYVFAGDLCLLRKDSVRATEFYQRACKLDPKESFAWNNLAAIWSTYEPLRLEEALQAANRAIELNPDPRFYDTRGSIHVKLKNWDEAIHDLEAALSGTVPNAGDAHRNLATSYDAIGQSEQAEAHRKLAATVPESS